MKVYHYCSFVYWRNIIWVVPKHSEMGRLAAVFQKRLPHTALAAHDFGKPTCGVHFRQWTTRDDWKIPVRKNTSRKSLVSLRIKEMTTKKRTASSTPNSVYGLQLTIEENLLCIHNTHTYKQTKTSLLHTKQITNSCAYVLNLT